MLERRKEQEGVKGEKQIAKAEPARQKIEEETKNASRSANRTDVALPADSQRGDDGEDDDTNIRKTRQGKGKNNSEETMNARKESEARRKEEVARAANALQKREKLARSRKAPTASRKSTRTRMTVRSSSKRNNCDTLLVQPFLASCRERCSLLRSTAIFSCVYVQLPLSAKNTFFLKVFFLVISARTVLTSFRRGCNRRSFPHMCQRKKLCYVALYRTLRPTCARSLHLLCKKVRRLQHRQAVKRT